LRHKYPESFSKIGVPKNKRHGVEDSLAERLFTPISMSAIENFVRPVMSQADDMDLYERLPFAKDELKFWDR
jgi:hypothetical protein